MRHASAIADNVNYITTSIRADVQQINATIAAANERLQQAVQLTERRMSEFNALLRGRAAGSGADVRVDGVGGAGGTHERVGALGRGGWDEVCGTGRRATWISWSWKPKSRLRREISMATTATPRVRGRCRATAAPIADSEGHGRTRIRSRAWAAIAAQLRSSTIC